MDWLFDTPWYVPSFIAASGITVFFFANQRGETRYRNIGLGIILLAMLIVGVSWTVDTAKEKAVKHTRELVRSFENRDWAAFEKLLPQQVSLGLQNYPRGVYDTKRDLVTGAKQAQERYNFKGIHILSTNAQQNDTFIAVYLDVITEQELTMGRPVTSSWEFDYTEAADGWALEKITALKIANQPVEQVISMFPK
jgi:hypothetical protein